MSEESILQEAQRLTHGPRRADYGHPLDDYSRTAMLINVLFAHKLRVPFDAEDATQIQMLVKLSRHQTARKRDNMVDAAGYAWATWECTEERQRRENEAPRVEDYNNTATALDSVSDDGIWRAAALAHYPGEYREHEALAPMGTLPLDPPAVALPVGPMWPDNAGAGVPVVPKGRLLACGCFANCAGQTPRCPAWVNPSPYLHSSEATQRGEVPT